MAQLYRRKIRPLLKGMRTWVGPNRDFHTTRGTDRPEYCYSVWLRHLALAAQHGLTSVPRNVAEIGPGDSLGIGLAALISGVERYAGFDVVEYASTSRNLPIFDALVPMFAQRQPVPGPDALPFVLPRLATWEFPAQLGSLGALDDALRPERIATLRRTLEQLRTNAGRDEAIRYVCPWEDPGILEPESIDFVFAQAVFEHVNDIDHTYRSLAKWLRPGALFSQVVDFTSHSIVPDWNGHWSFSPFAWRMLVGRRTYLINRHTLGDHLRSLAGAGLEVVHAIRYHREPDLPAHRLAKPFREADPEDLRTYAAYILARKT